MRVAHNIEQVGALPIDYMGFIFYEKSPRHVSILPALQLPHTIQKVGVFVNASTAEILQRVAEHKLNAVQLHGGESPAQCEELRKEGLLLFKAFGIAQDFDWTVLQPYLPVVDYFLFDTKSVQYGGTGKTFDWKVLNLYPYENPYFLSGGLALENIAQALNIDDARLVGLDLNSKFEIAPGLKHIEKLTQAVKLIKDE